MADSSLKINEDHLSFRPENCLILFFINFHNKGTQKLKLFSPHMQSQNRSLVTNYKPSRIVEKPKESKTKGGRKLSFKAFWNISWKIQVDLMRSGELTCMLSFWTAVRLVSRWRYRSRTGPSLHPPALYPPADRSLRWQPLLCTPLFVKEGNKHNALVKVSSRTFHPPLSSIVHRTYDEALPTDCHVSGVFPFFIDTTTVNNKLPSNYRKAHKCQSPSINIYLH